MKFGVREICDVVFKATDDVVIGNTTFAAGQPVLYIDTAKTSSLAGAATTVYATGGKGNSRLLAWEGEKTLTFTVEDAMLSPLGFSVLTGAGLLEAENTQPVYVHTTAEIPVIADGTSITVKSSHLGLAADATAKIYTDAASDVNVYGTVVDSSGAVVRVLGAANTITDPVIDSEGIVITFTGAALKAGERVLIDFYVERKSNVKELSITPDKFGGYYYVEASTLFREQLTGTDLPAEIIIPKVKIQSNFTFNMAASGDPSTFSFVMDAFPATTKFSNDKVLCLIQIVEDDESLAS